MDKKGIQEASSLKEAFQGMVPEIMKVIEGTVISASPLKIKAANDDKLIIEPNITCLPRHLTDYTTQVDIMLGKGSLDSKTDEGTCDSAHTHMLETYNIYKATMKVYNGLKAGETVYILSFNNGKKYYILDREG